MVVLGEHPACPLRGRSIRARGRSPKKPSASRHSSARARRVIVGDLPGAPSGRSSARLADESLGPLALVAVVGPLACVAVARSVDAQTAADDGLALAWTAPRECPDAALGGAACGGREISLGENADAGAAEGGSARPGAIACGAPSSFVACAPGAICCAQKGGPTTCQVSACAASAISIACDGPEDCPGQVCCEKRTDPASAAANAACDPACAGPFEASFCHVSADCPAGSECCPPGGPTHGRCVVGGCG
jgi:hypothetical protein